MMPRLEEYIESHSTRLPEWLYAIYRRTNLELLNGRMCSGPVQGELLTMLTRMIKPDKVLEIGTFSGFSALCIARGLEGNASLLTIEADDELEGFIGKSIQDAPEEVRSRIELRIGAALDVMKDLESESYDMIFIDADKREYTSYYEASMKLLRPGGFIIADNTLWDGHVIDSAYNRDKQTNGIKDFNRHLAEDARTEQVILPLRDGLTLIMKSKSKQK